MSEERQSGAEGKVPGEKQAHGWSREPGERTSNPSVSFSNLSVPRILRGVR